MIYLLSFTFPDAGQEAAFFKQQKRTCYDTFYPFNIFSNHQLVNLDFEPITILYGGNGSGKTTALNVIAETLKLQRDSLYNKTNFFQDYVEMCKFRTMQVVPRESRIITSDDVFDFMLDLRGINNGIHQRREEIFQEYLDTKYSNFQMKSLEDYDELKKVNAARHQTQSKYVRHKLMNNIREHSNGESAFIYFTEKIRENALYLLDEPENSLSPSKQKELVAFLEESVRFFNCQFIISTHSPFLLALKGAKIYDMDEEIIGVKKWSELSSIRAYYEFFKEYEEEFK
ncbi:AAA family ATPase [Cellulosilyticum ruminicola]|uniref:AAA family ATPase n=1 Tax=Cellulosilyticum ruminicola TaxID=425254 RepID=UPI0006D19B83|nr:AAA family ATPase [Cellulosilyticum ruminicola]